MDFNENWDENLVLNFVESTASVWSISEQKSLLTAVNMYFTFYGHDYLVRIDVNDITKESPALQMEGDSKLFDSFQRLIEEDMWPKVKVAFQRYDIWYDEHFSGKESEVQNG